MEDSLKPKVLFVCVENSCRSQMAEGFARLHGNGLIDAWSAGSKPSGKINETGISVMKEKGIDLASHTSKGLTDLPGVKWDYVITMGCGDACPFVPSRRTEDWGIPDPKHLPLDEFRKVRDMVETRVKALIDEVRG
jgi:arsenate reductase (thioredoxin)